MVVVDVETTGLNAFKHSIVSIGAVDFLRPSEMFYGECRIWMGAEVDDAALAVNGFTLEQVQYKNPLSHSELMQRFALWWAGREVRILAGQNPSFDRDFIRAGMNHASVVWEAGFRTIDLHSLYCAQLIKKRLHGEKIDFSSTKLDVILPFVGLPPEPVPHIGINGAKLEAEAFSRIMQGRGLLDEYRDYPVPHYLLQS